MPLFLIVGSDDRLDRVVKRVIERQGSTARIINNATALIEHLRASGHTYDEIIFNGSTLAGANVAQMMLRVRTDFPSVPIIYHTAHARDQIKNAVGVPVEALEKENITYVAKGRIEDLIEAMRRLF
jgi:DNA-binding NtrC family response regulator